jgi:site-specific recombinase XerD
MQKPKLSLSEFAALITTGSEDCNNEAVVARFVSYLSRVRNRSKDTVRAYDSLLRMWVDHLDGHPIFQVSLEQMEDFVNRPRMRRGAGTNGAPASRKRDADILRSFYRWAHENRLTDENLALALHGPTVHNINPKPVPDDVWLQIWTPKLTPPDAVMLGFGFFLGLRRSEMADLSAAQVTDERIVNFVRKGGGEDTLDWRTVMRIYEQKFPTLLGGTFFYEAVAEVTHRQRGQRYLLPFGGTGDRVTKRVSHLGKQAGLRGFSPHMLRHSAATNLLRAGVPLHLVKDILNHSSIDITMRYVKAGGSQLKEWLDMR